MAAAFVCVCLYCRRSCIVISFTRTVGSMRDLSAILIPRGFVMRAGKQLFFFSSRWRQLFKWNYYRRLIALERNLFYYFGFVLEILDERWSHIEAEPRLRPCCCCVFISIKKSQKEKNDARDYFVVCVLLLPHQYIKIFSHETKKNRRPFRASHGGISLP